MKHLGLFEGIGGFSLAARWMEWQTVAWCEWDKNCQRVLKYHFPNAIPHDDITKTDFTRYAGQIDILTGGFPCQPYSSAGKRLGKEDDRHLWPEMLRGIREVQPTWVVGENVRGLTNWNGGLVFNEVQADLEAAGYEVLPFLLPACAVDAPHRRDRIWFVAHARQAERTGWYKSSERQQYDGGRDARSEFAPFGCIQDAANSSEVGRENRIHGEQQRGQASECGNPFQKPDWQQFPTQSPLCSRNDGVPAGLDGITFPKWREFSIGAYGNAIVPQVALQIFKAIQEHETHNHHRRSGNYSGGAAQDRSSIAEKPGYHGCA